MTVEACDADAARVGDLLASLAGHLMSTLTPEEKARLGYICGKNEDAYLFVKWAREAITSAERRAKDFVA